MEMSIAEIVQLIASGGTLAYATLVYLELRATRQAQLSIEKARAEQHEQLSSGLAQLQQTIAVLLDRSGRTTPPLGIVRTHRDD